MLQSFLKKKENRGDTLRSYFQLFCWCLAVYYSRGIEDSVGKDWTKSLDYLVKEEGLGLRDDDDKDYRELYSKIEKRMEIELRLEGVKKRRVIVMPA